MDALIMFLREVMEGAGLGTVAFPIIVQGLTINRLFKADQPKRLLD